MEYASTNKMNNTLKMNKIQMEQNDCGPTNN